VEEQSLVAVVVVNNSVKKIEMIIIHRGTWLILNANKY
jgi:hypothetical protein